jgi:hypothetical protein
MAGRMNEWGVWICPRCNSTEPYGQNTSFGRYTAADAALNHVEREHPEVTL